MSGPKLATIHVLPPLEDGDGWSVDIDPEDSSPGAWFEFATAGEAFEHAMKWIADRGLRWDCDINVYPGADR